MNNRSIFIACKSSNMRGNVGDTFPSFVVFDVHVTVVDNAMTVSISCVHVASLD